MPSNPPPRVLCVDDDEDAAEMLTLLLRFRGIEVTCASSAFDAWPKLQTEPFDLLVLDVWLPLLGGFQFCRQIRECGFKMPILFYSGAASITDKQNGIAAGADAYVTKPDIDCLIDTVLELVERPKTAGMAARGGKHRDPAPNPLPGRLFAVASSSD